MARTVGSNGEQTAQILRKAALRLFAEKGYAAVSMREIAKEVGIQAGALYNHYPTKQAILADLMLSHMQDLIKAWEQKGKAFFTPTKALDGFVKFHIEFHLDKPDEVFISYMELRNLEPENFAKLESQRRLYEGFLRKIVQAGQQEGEFKVQDVAVTSMAIIAMLTGLNTWYRQNGRLDVSDIEEIYTNLVRGAVGANELSKTENKPHHLGQMIIE